MCESNERETVVNPTIDFPHPHITRAQTKNGAIGVEIGEMPSADENEREQRSMSAVLLEQLQGVATVQEKERGVKQSDLF